MKYSLNKTEVRPYHAGVLINIRSELGMSIGEIHATKANRYTVLELQKALKGCLQDNDDFDDLVSRVRANIRPYGSTLEIKYIFD